MRVGVEMRTTIFFPSVLLENRVTAWSPWVNSVAVPCSASKDASWVRPSLA